MARIKKWEWGVVAVERPVNNVIAMGIADATLRLEREFDYQVYDWWQEDFAQRN